MVEHVNQYVYINGPVELVDIEITATRDGVDYDWTEDEVTVAVTAIEDTFDADTATWHPIEGTYTTEDGRFAVIELGGEITFTETGHYHLHTKQASVLEDPVKYAGIIEVT